MWIAIRGEGGEECLQPGTRWARREERSERLTLQIVVAKGNVLGLGLEKKIERVDDRHFGDEIHREREDGRLFRKRQAGEEVTLRILLPVDEVVRWLDPQRVAADGRATVRRRPQPYDLGRQGHGPVVPVDRLVVQGDANAHGLYRATETRSHRENRNILCLCDSVAC